MSGALLPLALAGIMFALGLGLVAGDFRRVWQARRAVLAGLLAQVAGLPLIAFLLLEAGGIGGTTAVGVMILAACPGGVSAGLLTRLAGGETALSISLTALTSVGILLSLPLVVGAALAHFVGTAASLSLPVGRTVGGVVLVTLLPVLAGMLVRHRLGARAACWEARAARLATGLFLAIVLLTFVEQRAAILAQLPTLGPLLAVLNLLVMALGVLAGRLAGLAAPGRIALAMECGLQNAALGIFVAHTLLGEPALAGPSVVYAFLMNLSALAWVLWRRRQPLAGGA